MAGLFRPLPSCGPLGDIPLARYAPFSPGIRPAGYGRVSPAWAVVHSNPAHRSGSPPSLLCWIFLAAHHVTSGRPRPCISPPHTRCTTDQTPVTMCGLLACRGRPEHRPKLWSYASTVWSGADDGVRSRAASLEGWNAANYITSAYIRQHYICLFCVHVALYWIRTSTHPVKGRSAN